MIKRCLPLLLACSAPAAADPLPLIDLTDEFAALWDETQTMDEAARISAFNAKFDALLPGFYRAKRTGGDPAKYDARLAKGFNAFPAQRDGIAEVSRRFASMLEPSRTSFEAVFGPLGDMPAIYLINSFGEMDGGTRTIEGKSHLVFGADMIAKLHGKHNVQPFFHHELFHVYHGRTFEGCEQVWCGLWTEGLATLVAADLNPGSTEAELLLTHPEPVSPVFDTRAQEAFCFVHARLDAKSSDSGLFVGSKRPSDTLPPRLGYYVGYLVAAEARHQVSQLMAASDAEEIHPLAALAKLPAPAVRELIDDTLRGLGGCA
jgi:hypothetical protein